MEPFPEIDTQPGYLRAWENDGFILHPLVPEGPSEDSYMAFLDHMAKSIGLNLVDSGSHE